MNREAKELFLKLPLVMLDQALDNNVHCLQVGANDGKIADPLYPFLSTSGWKGILLEPNPLYFNRVAALHKDNENVTVLNIGASDKEGAFDLYYLAQEHENLYGQNIRGCASFDRDRMLAALTKHRDDGEAHLAHATVPVRPVRTLLAELNVATTDVLVIDTEGHEPSVLAGIDIDVLQPKVAIVENNTRGNKEVVAEPFLSAGYDCFNHMGELIALSPAIAHLHVSNVYQTAGIGKL